MRTSMAGGVAAAVLALSAGLPPCLGQGATPLVVRAGKVITVAGEPLAPGAVLIREGKIAAVGPTVEAPEGATVLHFPDGVVIPGLVAAFTTLAEGGRDTERSVTPELRSGDGLDRYADWRQVLAGGVTTVYLSPPQGRLIPGWGAVAKLGKGAPSARLLREAAALRVVLGEWPQNPPLLWEPPLPPTAEKPSSAPEPQLPTSRMGEMAKLREVFAAARAEKADDSTAKLIAPALDGTSPLRVKADRAEDIRNALALAEEFPLKLIIEGGTEAYALADQIAARGVAVVLTPPVRPGRPMADDLALIDILGVTRSDSAARLIRVGVPVALSIDDEALGDLLMVGAAVVGSGAPPETVLRAITLDAATLLGVADQTGSLEVGKDADLVVLSGEPFATRTAVRATISDGRVVYEAGEDPVAEPSEPLRVLRARRIFTGNGAVITDGEVRLRGAIIEAVGERREPPPGAVLEDFADRVIAPGMIDMQSHLGLHWESEGVTLNPQPATSGAGSGGAHHVSIAYAVDPADPAFGEALRAGVTSVLLAPGDEGLFCGTAALVKTFASGVERVTVKPVAALKFSMLGARDKLSTIWEVRSLLERAKTYHDEWTEFDRRWREFERRHAAKPEADLKEPSRPRRDSQLEALRALFRDRVPVLVAAERTDEISDALKVFREEYGLSTALLGAGDSFRMADTLRTEGAMVSVGPEVLREERGRKINPAADLARLGVPVTFQSDGTSGAQFLRLAAAYAVRHGMDGGEALRALTARPAEFLRLDHRLGCLAPGRDADLVVLSGDPLELASRVEKVFVNGSLAYDASAQQ